MVVYSTPRSYQLQALERAQQQNTIVNLGTGTGKTLIAAMLIDELLGEDGHTSDGLEDTKKALFVVPTNELALQQTQYLRTELPHRSASVSDLRGASTSNWGPDQWQHEVNRSKVIVATAEVARRILLDQRLLDPEELSVVVFDECHNCGGQSPMALICRNALHCQQQQENRKRPRILGLTASFCRGGKVNALQQERADLEKLLQATIYTPEDAPPVATGRATGRDRIDSFCSAQSVHSAHSSRSGAPPPAAGTADGVVDESEEEHDQEGHRSRREVQYENVAWNRDKLLRDEKVAEARREVEQWLTEIAQFGIPLRDPGRHAQKAALLLTQCGWSAFEYFLSECLLPQLSKKADMVAMYSAAEPEGPEKKKDAELLKNHMADKQAELRGKCREMKQQGTIFARREEEVSPKFVALLDLLERENVKESEGRGIIFVEERVMTEPLRMLLELARYRVGCIAGGREEARSSYDAKARKVMEDFRTGRTNLLVATAVLQEGIDVPECNMVVWFDAVTTVKSHIQGSGRARSKVAKIFFFESDWAEMERMRKQLEEVAGNANLGTTDAQREQARLQTVADRESLGPNVHPFRLDEDHGAIDVSNASRIFNEYLQLVIKQNVKPDAHFFLYETEKTCTFPPQERKVLKKVVVPTPEGEISVTAEDVRQHWGEVGFDDARLWPSAAKKPGNAAKRERSWFVLVALVLLVKKDYLTPDKSGALKPSAIAIRETSNMCGPYAVAPEMNVPTNFADASAPTSGPAAPPLGPVEGATDATQDVGEAGGGVPDAGVSSLPTPVPGVNYKNALQEHFQKLRRTAPVYEQLSGGGVGQFQAKVRIESEPGTLLEFCGIVRGKKKDAEMAAACTAVAALRIEIKVAHGS
ncbi:unnamed protein product [Amoebophrya sp. A120]|nr:unnamed protein product [Amoebophrya sp. A120]|eukprot:GSA120T00017391001.1